MEHLQTWLTVLFLGVIVTAASSQQSRGGGRRKSAPCKCDDKTFACSATRGTCSCIPAAWRCDTDNDCGDHSDELDCVRPTCAPDLFQCSNGKCIRQDWKCDGDNDCGDESDEPTSCDVRECDATERKCKNGDCILKRWWCDGDSDCGDKSDESDCHKPEECKASEFRCPDGKCIEKEWRCDEDFDCSDGSDEENCYPDDATDRIPANETIVVIPCKPEEFECTDADTGFVGDVGLDSCIPQHYVCDGEPDCENGSDESNCTHPCTSEEFRCMNGQCISLHNHCDGTDDCGDGSDEEQCADVEMCIEGEFTCRSGMCISRLWRCDGDSDCNDGSDEEECTGRPHGMLCDVGQFQCLPSNVCIRAVYQCDGVDDCEDKSDEKNCGTCASGQYRCLSGDCIAIGKVCNKKPDCSDGSDERPIHSCNGSMILGSNYTSCADNNGGCEQTCKQSRRGALCTCGRGFQIAPDLQTCLDVDECRIEGSCSQICNNTIGSFTCSCLDGYTLRPNGRTCKASGPEPALLFTNRIEIRKMMPDRSENTPILRDLENAIGLDYHIELGLMFWTDVALDRVMRSYMNGSGQQIVVSSGLESPAGVAVDWIHNLLYWTDSGTSRIEVSRLDGSFRKVLIWERLQKPRALALHPAESLIFWTDWGETPCLESAAMDGSMRRPVVSRNLQWPNGLTIDYTRNHVYWADARYRVIEKVNLDGSDRRTVVSRGLPHPFGVTIFEDNLYWTDWHTKSVNSANKFTGDGVQTIRNRLHFPMDIQTYHPLRQPKGPNWCSNASCSHLCLPRPGGITCACPTGFRTVNTTHCAQHIERFLVFTCKTDIRRISFDGAERADTVLPIRNLTGAIALDLHSQGPAGHLYWSDIDADTISRSEWDGTNAKVLVSTSLVSPVGIAIDWVTNKMYWTDSGINRIEVALLDGSMRCVLVWTGLDRPRGIIVHPKSGTMIWSDWGTEPKIERAGMDGAGRKTIVSTGITWPNGVAIDYATDRLYWTDAGRDIRQIESCDLDGENRRVILSGLPHPFGITIDETRIYWTDWDLGSINSADKETGKDKKVLRNKLDNPMDIRFFGQAHPISPNPCSVRNGGCSHLCLLSTRGDAPFTIDGTPFSCACPTGLSLGTDDKQCNTKMNKFLAIARRTDIRVISLDVPYSADVKLPIDAYMANVVDVAVDPVENYIYWSDMGSREITRSSLVDPTTSEVVIGFGLDTVDGIALDHVGRLLYWADDGRDQISVASLDGKQQRILLSDRIDSPRAIALFYSAGYMYWTDWGKNAKIERAGLDGSNRSVIIESDLKWPNAITIDEEGGLVIWGDAQTEKIECSDLLGNNRRSLHTATPHPYSLAFFEGAIYWNDWQTRNIYKMSLQPGDNTTVDVVRENMPRMMGIKAVAMDVNGTNRCGVNNGGCSHLCLRSPTANLGFRCACPTGIRLQEDGRTCAAAPEEYLLFATRLSIRRVSLESDRGEYVELPIGEMENTIALDYHYDKQLLFFTDVYLDAIKRSSLDGSNVQTIVSSGLKTMDGVAVDWVANNIFWTDAALNQISVARLDGSSRKVAINQGLDEPRALAVHPSRGLIFWTDWGGKARIEKAFMDGTGRKTLVRKNIKWPNGLTVDYKNSRIFWIDAHEELNRIETCDFNGRKRRVVVPSIPHGFSITYLNNALYWTDWQTNSVHKASSPFTSSKRSTVISGLDDVMDIKAVSPKRQVGTSPCDVATGYGGCTHLCLMRGPIKYVCACPDPIAPAPTVGAEDKSILGGKDGKAPPLDHPETLLRECSLLPMPPTTTSKADVIVSSTSSTARGNSSSGAATTVMLGPSSGSSGGGGSDIVRLVGAFLGAAFIVFIIIAGCAILMWRRFKRKRSEDAVSIFGNPTYHANRGGTPPLMEQAPQSTFWKGPDAHHGACSDESKSFITGAASTAATDLSQNASDVSDIEVYDEQPTHHQYSAVSTLEAPPKMTPSRKLGTAGLVPPTEFYTDSSASPPCGYPLLDTPPASDDNDSSSSCSADEDDVAFASSNKYSLSGIKAIASNRLLRHLVDKQPKVSTTTQCTMLSEDERDDVIESDVPDLLEHDDADVDDANVDVETGDLI